MTIQELRDFLNSYPFDPNKLVYLYDGEDSEMNDIIFEIDPDGNIAIY